MTGWTTGPEARPPVAGDGLVAAGLGSRLGAWVVDAIVTRLGLGLALTIVLFASRAIEFNPAATDQGYFGYVPAPAMLVNQVGLIGFAGLYLVLTAAYYAVCWARYRGTLGQRLLSLDVVDVRSADNLSLGRALVRWIVVDGFAFVAALALGVWLIETLATVPYSATPFAKGAPNFPVTVDPRLNSVGTESGVLASLTAVWSIALLISVAVQLQKRGIHDRLGGSVVLGNAPVVVAPAYPGWSPAPPTPADRPAPPDPAGNAAAAYGAPAYPPAAYAGYGYPPPAGYAAYPGYPGYPPPAGHPPAPPAPPPVAGTSDRVSEPPSSGAPTPEGPPGEGRPT